MKGNFGFSRSDITPRKGIFEFHGVHSTKHSTVHNWCTYTLHVTEDEDGSFSAMERPYLPESAWSAFEDADVRRMSRPCENITMWAVTALRKGSFTVIHFRKRDSLNDETLATMVRLIELTSPGIINQLMLETGLELGLKYAESITTIDGDSWRLREEPMLTIDTKGNPLVKYDGLTAKPLPDKWFPDKFSQEIRNGGEKAMLRSILDSHINMCNAFKTDSRLTSTGPRTPSSSITRG